MAISEPFKTHPSYLATLTEITGDMPQGPVSCEHDDYDYILETLKKIGSLHQDSIVWDTVASTSLHLIEHERKDINLFAAHLLALLHQNHDGNGFLCVALIQTILDQWFERAYPSTAKPKSVKLWNNRINQVGVKLRKHAEHLLLNERHLPHQAMVEGLLSTISDNEALDVIELKSALRYLRDNLAAIQTSVVSPPTQSHNKRAATIAKPAIKPKPSNLSAKELKQCYQSIIEHQSSIDLYDPMVYRLRRHMLWSSIHSAPDKDDDSKTALFAPPVDLRDFYKQQLNEAPTEEVWQRLESSLENSPYWVSGHYLSHQFAQALGYEAVAVSIKEEVTQFTQRLPTIDSLLFADKGSSIPFVDDDTRQWLATPDEADIPEEEQSDEAEEVTAPPEAPEQWLLELPLPSNLTDTTKQLIEAGDTAGVLTVFNDYLSQPLEPRSRCYSLLIMAEAYEKLSMKHMAVTYYQQVWTVINDKDLQLERWEPKLITHVKNKILVLGLVESSLVLEHKSPAVENKYE